MLSSIFTLTFLSICPSLILSYRRYLASLTAQKMKKPLIENFFFLCSESCTFAAGNCQPNLTGSICTNPNLNP